MKAAEICQHAAGLVSGERDRTHGEKHGNHARIAAHWNAYLHARWPGCVAIIQPRDVAAMMVLLKVARSTFGAHNPDDAVDMVGYASIYGELADRDAATADRIIREHDDEVRMSTTAPLETIGLGVHGCSTALGFDPKDPLRLMNGDASA